MDYSLTYHLESKERFLPLLNDFLNKSIKEHYSNPDTNSGETSYAMFYKEFVKHNANRNVNLIYQYCESPIERIFLSSILLLFIKNGYPCLHFTEPLKDAESFINGYRENHLAIMRLIDIYKETTGDKELSNFEEALRKKVGNGSFTQEEAEEITLHNTFIKNFAWNSYHITIQAGFPRIIIEDRSIRTDLLIWIPSDVQNRITVECDGFVYHNTKESFKRDRIRDRQLQLNGYKVIRFSGSEINKDPIKVSNELFDLLDTLDTNSNSRVL